MKDKIDEMRDHLGNMANVYFLMKTEPGMSEYRRMLECSIIRMDELLNDIAKQAREENA